MKHFYLKSLLCMVMMLVGMSAWAGTESTATYIVASTSSVTKTGTAPDGSTATWTQDYGTKCQMTEAKPNASFTLSGYDGVKISGISLNLKNTNSKKVNVTVTVGSTTIVNNVQISLSTTATDKTLTLSSTPVVGSEEDIVISLKASGSSVFCYNAKVKWETVTPRTVNLSKNGIVTQTTIYEPYNLPTAENLSSEWKFKGWSSSPVASTTTKPTFVTNATEDDQTVYAVYGQSENPSTFDLISNVNDIVEGKYAIAVNKVNSSKYNFADGSFSSGHAGVEATGIDKADSFEEDELPSGAKVYELVGDNTNGFSIKEIESNTYFVGTAEKGSLSYESSATETWIFSADDVAGFNLTGAKQGSKVSVNSTTAASAIRNYASTGAFYDGLFFFLLTTSGTTTYNSNPSCSLTIGPAGYATYYNSASKYTMPANMEGYVWFDGSLDKGFNAGDVVPAGEPLVLKAAQGNYTLTFTSAAATQQYKAESMNDLEGTDTETAITADASSYFYGLSMGKAGSANEGKVGFYWMNETGAAFTNGAHKAYLKLAKGSGVKAQYVFGEDETAISQIENGNLKIENGKFMENGKIVIMKNGKKYNAAGLQIR